ncbi:MAG: methionyl-tRNA formyltransferase [Nitrospiraceae bacterium]|nr:methionyl-tRNA formyltransferase [Nitrospiraceae bacterium]
MSIVFFGTPMFAVSSLEALHGSGEEIAAVVTRKDALSGRGKNKKSPKAPPVQETALRYGLRVLQPTSLKGREFVEEIKSYSPEFLVVAAYGKILTEEVLSIPRIAPVNVHASVLPQLRGASPIARAIISGLKETGVTTMRMDKGLDTGDILLVEKTAIRSDDDAASLSERLAEIGAALLLKTLKGMREGTVKPRPQEGEATYAPPLRKEEGLINWGQTAGELFNFVRGMNPWPGAFFFLDGERIKILKAETRSGSAAPGEVAKARGELLAGTAEGLLSLVTIQPEGKNPMSAQAFLQGRKIKEKDIFNGAAQSKSNK